MGSGNGNDFLNSDFPMYAAAGVCLFGAYRAFVSKSRGEAMQPAWMSSGTFPAAFFTGIGTMACHEMLMDITAFPGGLTAWAPAVLTVIACSWVAYRGQRAASGGDLGAFSIVPAVALVCLFISWLVTDDAEPPQNLTKAQLKKAAKDAAKKAAKALAAAPTAKMLSLENGNDVVSEYMHVALAVAVVLALILGLVNGPGEWPRNLQTGAFPACFMVASGVIAWNSFLREARSFGEGSSADDFVPALAAMVVACIGASAGSKMQA